MSGLFLDCPNSKELETVSVEGKCLMHALQPLPASCGGTVRSAFGGAAKAGRVEFRPQFNADGMYEIRPNEILCNHSPFETKR